MCVWMSLPWKLIHNIGGASNNNTPPREWCGCVRNAKQSGACPAPAQGTTLFLIPQEDGSQLQSPPLSLVKCLANACFFPQWGCRLEMMVKHLQNPSSHLQEKHRRLGHVYINGEWASSSTDAQHWDKTFFSLRNRGDESYLHMDMKWGKMSSVS